MKRSKILKAALVGSALTFATAAGAVSNRTTPAIDASFERARSAINDGSYILAQQTLMSLTAMNEHRYSAVAQELLGNVREFKGQVAQAVAEYETYLEKFPREPGAARVRARLSALYAGRATLTPSQATAMRVRSAEMAEAASEAPATDTTVQSAGGKRTTQTSGSLSVVYRSSEATVEITDLEPDPEETTEDEYTYENSLSANAYISHRVDMGANSVELRFNGGLESDLDEDESSARISELSASLTTGAGVKASVGRIRSEPSAAAYRIDGVSITARPSEKVRVGFAAGYTVDSTSDDLFGQTEELITSAFAEVQGTGGAPDLTFYAYQQTEGDFTERQAVGIELSKRFENGGVYASAEYDLELDELGRAALGGNATFADGSRATVRLSFHRSPGLSLENALIGQDEETLEDLNVSYTLEEMQQLALDRSAEVKNFGATYYRKLNDTWGMNLSVNSQDVSGLPASGDVEAIEAEGVRVYGSIGFNGASVLKESDAVNLGLQVSSGDDDRLTVASAAYRIPVNEDLSIRPGVQVGQRVYEDEAMGSETFIVPRVTVQYKLDRQTRFDLELGARKTSSESDVETEDSDEVFVSAGLTRSF